MSDAIGMTATTGPTPQIVLTPEQSRALDAIGAWLSTSPTSRAPVLKLFGIAGVGKTTIARYVASLLDGPTRYVAYTGRACEMLRRKGMPAQTVHSALYLPMSERNDELTKLRADLDAATDDAVARRLMRRIEALDAPKFVLRSSDPSDPRGSPLAGAALIVADEMSMLSKTEAEDLLSFKIPLLVLGDPGQLPPIEGRGYFSHGALDILLTEIHRQALDSPVIRLADAARNRRPLKLGQYGTSRVMAQRDVTPAMALAASQILCGKNKTRVELIADLRRFAGIDAPLPVAGEKLICLRNNPRSNLFNGSELVLTNDVHDDPSKPYLVRVPTDKGEFVAYRDCFERPERIKAMPYGKRAVADEFDWAAALTVHRAQGGEWPDVLFWDDKFLVWAPEDRARLLYTAVTRAQDSITVAV